MKSTRGLWIFLIVLVLLSMMIAVGIKYYRINLDIKDVMTIMTKKMDVLARMRINLFKSVEAEKMAVMADTDESSRAYAEESQKAADSLEKDRRELDVLIKKDPTNQEIKLFQEFDRCWTEFRKIDQVLLDFAVKNTNIKAANLSFVQGSEAVKNFEEALYPLISNQTSSKADPQITQLISEAMVAGIKIHYLHAPHIAASNDEQMNKIETDIKKNEQIINRSLNELKPLVPQKKLTFLIKAKAAFDDLAKVTAQVIDLSRQNTNIKSFELSLGRKRKITAQCDEILTQLEESVKSRSIKATR